MSHPCRNYCSQWTGEQCKGCLISDEVDFAVGDLVVFDNKKPFMKRTQTTMFSFVRDWDENDAIVRAVSTEKTYEVNKLGIRLATLAEKAAGHRIDEVADGTPTNEDTTCTEVEEIVVGSMVVFAGATFNENVGEVLKITSKSIVGNYPASAILNFPSGYPSFSTELSKLRLATPAEIELGQRIDETEEELAAEAAAWRECREPCRFDQLEVEPESGWAIKPKAPVHTDLELMQKEMLLRFQHDCNFWCLLFWLAFIGYGIAFWWAP